MLGINIIMMKQNAFIRIHTDDIMVMVMKGVRIVDVMR